ncbi:MAG: triose-phosphate isomerase [Chloroflexi bacterium]|nr:MAG: triose-phosphate isomerase [Chloroflexota bacterium]
MRTPMMAGNWKMNKTVDEAVQLAQAIQEAVAAYDNVIRVVCPAAVALPAVKAVLHGGAVTVGAQNVHWERSGAFTGEISAPMLQGLADYVIIGHSERRQYFGETDETVNKKSKAALAHGLIPIICIGESLAQNQAGETAAIVGSQVRAALAGLTGEQVQALVIAYEPIWAIGTGLAATAQQAQEVCGGVVRQTLAELYGQAVADATCILYGGSTNEKNIGEIMQQPDIDGALIGGASLKVESYAAMVEITSALYR